MESNLKEYYKNIRKKHSNIDEVNDEILERIQGEYSEYYGLSPILWQITVTIFVIWSLLFSVFFINLVPEVSNFPSELVKYLSNKDFSTSFRMINLALLVSSLYAYYRSPILYNPEYRERRLNRKRRTSQSQREIRKIDNTAKTESNGKDDTYFDFLKRSYRKFYNGRPKLQSLTIFIGYIWAWGLIFYLYLIKTTCIILDIFTSSWLAFPFIVIIFLILQSLMNLIYHISKRMKKKTPELIIGKLIYLIDGLDFLESTNKITFTNRERTAKEIFIIANMMCDLYSKKFTQKPYLSTANMEMEKNSQRFKSISHLVVYPKDEKLDYVISIIIPYLNAFLKSNYNEIPEFFPGKPEVIQEKPKKMMYKILKFIFLILYLLIPLAGFIIFDSIFTIEFSQLINSFLTLFYAVWVLLGISNFVDDSNKELLSSNFGLIKSVLGLK